MVDTVWGLSYMFKFTFPYLSQCSDIPIQIVSGDGVLSIDMSTYVRPNLTFTETTKRLGFVIKADPSGNYHGTFKLSSNSSVIEGDTPYLLETITYTPIDYGKLDTVIFYGNSNTNKSSNECTMKIFTCAYNCMTCSYQNQDATSTNQLCDSCKSGYILDGAAYHRHLLFPVTPTVKHALLAVVTTMTQNVKPAMWITGITPYTISNPSVTTNI